MNAIREHAVILRIAVLAVLALLVVLSSTPPAAAQSPTTLTLSVPSGSVNEDAGTVTVTATLDQPAPAGGVEVTLTSRPIGSRAIAGWDFNLPAAFTIAENATSATADITLIDDTTVEPDRDLVLDATVNVPGITVTGVTFTLVNDDKPRLSGIYVYPQPDAGEGEGQVEANESVSTPLTPRFSESPLALAHSARVNPDVPSVIVRATGANHSQVRIGPQGALLPTTADAVYVNHALSNALNVSDGDNVIEVQVTAFGKTSTYTLTVTRGLLTAPDFSVTRGVRNGQPTLTFTLTEKPASNQEMRVQLRESTTDPWPAATESNLLPTGAGASAYTHTFNDIVVTGLAKGTAYEARVHLIEVSGPITDLIRAVASQSSAETEVTTLNAAPAPTGLTLTVTEPASGLPRGIVARWTAVEGAGSVDYHVRYRVADQTPEAAWSDLPQVSHTSNFVGPVENGKYDVQVAADNGIGPIAWSAIVEATVNHQTGGL